MKSDASDIEMKPKRRVKKRKKESMKNVVRNEVDESFWTNLVTEESMTKNTAEPANDITILTRATSEPAELNNMVLRKLLRGSRYFDPPEDSWGSCYNCGKHGHRAIDCGLEKKKKPCFLCGSTEHTFKRCKKERKCSICKIKGHRAKNCPETNKKHGSNTDKICLKCGDHGHDMFSCKNIYFPLDLKAVQCYICNSFGHLCCYMSADHVSKELSCYTCGGPGHTGLACTRLAREIASLSSPTSCYTCFQGCHFARECPHPLKGRSKLNGNGNAGNISSICSDDGVKIHFAPECPNPVMDSESSESGICKKTLKLISDEDVAAACSKPSRVGCITKDLRVSPVPCNKDSQSNKSISWISEDLSKSHPSYKIASKKISKQSQRTLSSWKHQIHSSNSGARASEPKYNYLVQPRNLDSQLSTRSHYQNLPPWRFFSYSNNSR